MLPKAVRNLTQELTRLPGIGPRTAERLSLHLLKQPENVVHNFADVLKEMHAQVKTCRVCFNLSEREECNVCLDSSRDVSALCVVEDALAVEAIEKAETYRGKYHVLGGVLSPLEGVTEEQLTFRQLAERLSDEDVQEVIIALDHTMESDVTTREVMRIVGSTGKQINVTRLARGLPTGGDIEFADTQTLVASFQGRQSI